MGWFTASILTSHAGLKERRELFYLPQRLGYRENAQNFGGKMFRRMMVILLIAALLLAACASLPAAPQDTEPGEGVSPDDPVSSSDSPQTGEPGRAPWEPAFGDKDLTRGNAFVDTSQVLTLESFPPQFLLHLTGSLPTPCHQLRANVQPPTDEDQIHVELYSVVDPEEICIQVLEPFEVNIPLGSYEQGSYAVLLNGKQIGQINP
jgi:hypothetical protein